MNVSSSTEQGNVSAAAATMSGSASQSGSWSWRPARDDPSHAWRSSRLTAPTHNFGFVAPNKQTAPTVKPPFEFPQKIVLSLSVVGWGWGWRWRVLNGRAFKQKKRGLGFSSHLIEYVLFLWMICISPHSFSFKMTLQCRGGLLPAWSSFPSASFPVSLY